MGLITNAQIRRITQELNAQNAILSAIAGKGGTYPVENWNDVQTIIKDGIAPKVFADWEQFEVGHTTHGTLPFDIVDFNNTQRTFDGNEPSMTLLLHPVIYGYQVGAQQALIACKNGLPAGTYSFKITSAYSSWTVGDYKFTLTHAVTAGGQLVTSGNAGSALTSQKLRLFTSPTSTVVVEESAITSGTGGTYLGEVAAMTDTVSGVFINHLQRASYGSNNYAESAIRQYLNGYGNDWWVPKTMFDRPPAYVGQAGFMTGLDADFLAVVGTSCVKTSTNTIYEAPDSEYVKNQTYYINDKFYPASRREIFGSDESAALADGSVQFESFVGLSNAERIKYDISTGAARYWWLRTPYVGTSTIVRDVSTSGALESNYATTGYGLVPACTIYGESDNPTR